MPPRASDLAHRLAANAEAVCRYYLPNGKRVGAYWCAGDVYGAPGRSLYVCLRGPMSGKGAAGRWTDAATGEHGDLLDLIQAARGLHGIGEALYEARRFLGLVPQEGRAPFTAPSTSSEAARRLLAASVPIAGTIADTYLRQRGIVHSRGIGALRFHPRCYYQREPGSDDGARNAWPALVAAVTSLRGEITGVQRTWLDPSGKGKAPIATPRRAMGHLLGHAVRFGTVHDVMAVGEGIETVLSLRTAMPAMPMAAALSAGHLAAFLPPPELRRLYIVRDTDRAGQETADRLANRMQEVGIETIVLAPRMGDFNDDLCQLGPGAVSDTVRVQLAPEDVSRFWRAHEYGRRER